MKHKIELFLKKILIVGECWEWQGACSKDGYGQFGIGSRTDNSKQTIGAHRFSLQYLKGLDLEDYYVLHKCDNRKCVNPDHLYLGTQLDNMKDASKRERFNPWDRRERNPSAKLNKKQVEEIFMSKQTICELAKIYTVHYETIRKIKIGLSWQSTTKALSI